MSTPLPPTPTPAKDLLEFTLKVTDLKPEEITKLKDFAGKTDQTVGDFSNLISTFSSQLLKTGSNFFAQWKPAEWGTLSAAGKTINFFLAALFFICSIMFCFIGIRMQEVIFGGVSSVATYFALRNYGIGWLVEFFDNLKPYELYLEAASAGIAVIVGILAGLFAKKFIKFILCVVISVIGCFVISSSISFQPAMSYGTYVIKVALCLLFILAVYFLSALAVDPIVIIAFNVAGAASFIYAMMKLEVYLITLDFYTQYLGSQFPLYFVMGFLLAAFGTITQFYYIKNRGMKKVGETRYNN